MAAPPTIAKPDTVELWFVDLNTSSAALDAVERQTPRLAASELKKISASASVKAAAERRTAYIALRVLIERFWGPDWRTTPYTLTGSGKPTIKGLGGSFSLAHVDRYALIGLARTGTIGVDLEPDRQPTVSDERRLRIENAAIALAQGAALPLPRQMRFLQAWVRLEAVAKADGRGIGRLLTGLGVIGADPASGPGFIESYARDVSARFWVQDVQVGEGCLAAIALDGQVPSLQPPLKLPSTVAEIEALLMAATTTASH